MSGKRLSKSALVCRSLLTGRERWRLLLSRRMQELDCQDIDQYMSDALNATKGAEGVEWLGRQSAGQGNQLLSPPALDGLCDSRG